MFQKAAIFLEAGIPATGLHAVGLTRAAIGDAGRDGSYRWILFTAGDASILLAAAAHGGRMSPWSAKRDRSGHHGYAEKARFK